ncbi:MAG TPA: PIN domain-containing protein [Burkholderiales bacterium]|nr:PIN domain-containing protein [Burkholderiales bacterium]
MNRVFLDANVLFTGAHNPAGKAALVVALGVKGRWEVVSSSYAVEEARRNIASKFPQSQPRLQDLIDSISVIASGSGADCPVKLPEKDRPIMEAAIRSQATHLLTGDLKDFGALMNKPRQTAGIVIQTVAQYLSSL